MSNLQLKPNEDRVPEIIVLRDGRHRLTRFIKIAHRGVVPADLATAKGTADAATWGWTNAPRLVDIILTDDAPRPGMESHPWMQLVYEELPATAEVLAGADDISYDESGFKTIVAESLQMSAGPYAPGTVGTTTNATDATCILKSVEEEDDGTVRKIKRTYVNGGTLTQTDDTKNGGALLLRTLVSWMTVPATPSGYTVFRTDKQNVGGYPIYTYQFAKGTGEVSRRFTNAQGGATDFDPAAPNSSTGPVKCVIEYLTAASVTTDPTTRPANFIRLNVDKEDRDGHRAWTVTFGYGTGLVETATETKEGGKLIVYRQTELNPSGSYTPTAPSATIGGTVTLISRTKETSEGAFIFRSVWAEGFGEVSRSTSYGQSSAGDGSVGSTTIVITHLTAPGASIPTSAPSGTVQVESVPTAQDGYLVWRVTYAKGVGTVLSTNETREGGKLVLYRRVALGTAPSAPSATISGFVTSTGTGYREDAGFKVYDYTWAEGVGTIEETPDIRYGGKLVITRKRGLGAVATAWSQAAPQGIAFDSTGNSYVANNSAGTVVKRTPAGTTTTFATGIADPRGLVFDSGGNLFVADYGTGQIYKITSLGVMTVFAGGFNGPIGLTIDAANNLYLSNYNGNTVSKVTPAAVVTTFASGFSGPYGLWYDSATTNLFVANISTTTISKVTSGGVVSTYATGFRTPSAVVMDSSGILLALDQTLNTLSRITPGGVVTMLASGFSNAGFLALDSAGNIFVTNVNSATVTEVTAPPPAPRAAIGGTVTNTQAAVRQETGYIVYDFAWAEGFGVIDDRKVQRGDGLMEWHRTILSADTLPITASTFNTTWTPDVDGTMLPLRSRLEDGYTVTEAVWMLADDGASAPTAGTVATQAWVPFRYPGQAKYFSVAATAPGPITINNKDVFLSPPIEVLVLATTTITYQASSAVGSLAGTQWNPTQYATLRVSFMSGNGFPRSIVKGLEGYTSINAGSSGTASAGFAGSDTSCMGEIVYQGGSWSVALSGGPTMPNGSTSYTLHAEVEKEPSFVKYDGTKYYRRIEMTATPAALPALPV